MLTEAQAIPYAPSPLRGERLLVLAPHPDDEVIACGGLIALHLREGRSVRVVVATDGAKATGAAGDSDDYRRLREEESRRGLRVLGNVDVRFLGFPDRGLGSDVIPALREQLLDYRPDLISLPSPVEIHPDHFALARAFCDLIQRDEMLHAELATTQIAFYEVSQPLRPNALVDITSVASLKYAAIAEHESQIALKDYIAYARGLNSYRAMTLPPEVKEAEGYWLTRLPELRTVAFSELRRRAGHPVPAEVVREQIPMTVVIRTKDRPAQLREAIESVLANEYNSQIIVVNDGGGVLTNQTVKVIHHQTSRGRSEAMNSGVRAAETAFVAFLDDDDLFYPEHLTTLANAVHAAPTKVAWYTDSVSTTLEPGPTGEWRERSRLRVYGDDFDRDVLLVDNYIPLPTLVVPREAYLAAGGFDPSFDLFEDWDFLIRLSKRGDFHHVPRVTCEVRHFRGAGSIILEAPEGSQRFRAAKLAVWAKHASEIDNNTFANVYERQKRRMTALYGAAVEEKGRRSHAELDVARLDREKTQLMAEMGAMHLNANQRFRELESEVARLELELREERAKREKSERDAASSAALLRSELDETRNSARVAYAEVERLQGLLDLIYRSRTWKLHSMVEKIKGRG